MTDATVQMLVSQLGNAGVQNSSKKEIMEACAGLPDFGKILSNAGQKNDMFSMEERGASQSWNKDVANSDASVSNKVNGLNETPKASNEPSKLTQAVGNEETMSESERLGFGSGETDVEETAEALIYLACQMMQVITEQFNVTEEQVNTCLAQNNLIMTDLLDPTKLTDVFVQLSGSEVELVDVVSDEGFTNMLDAFDECIVDNFGEVPVEPEDLMNKAHILVDYNIVDTKMTELHTPEQVDSDDDNVMAIFEDAPKTYINDEIDDLSDNMEIVYNEEEAVNVTEETSDTNNADMNNGDDNQELAAGAFIKNNEAQVTKDDSEEKVDEDKVDDRISKLFSKKRMGLGDNSSEINSLLKNLEVKSHIVKEAEVPTVQYSDMVSKVSEFIETLSKDNKITSLQMLLNPENLGKVTVELATKEGVVSAKVIAETQTAKEALEANLASLKSNLENQGVKISDVEVTVESHAFEQNLQQEGSREQEQLAKEMQKETGRHLRSINLREVGLEELRGLMSEEDMIVAKMMADNGNTLNIKA